MCDWWLKGVRASSTLLGLWSLRGSKTWVCDDLIRLKVSASLWGILSLPMRLVGLGVCTSLPVLRGILNLPQENGQGDEKWLWISVWPDLLALQARLCGFMATESELTLTHGPVVTSYGSRRCLPLGTLSLPVRQIQIGGLYWSTNAKRNLSPPLGCSQAGTWPVSSLEEAPTLVCLCCTDSGRDTQGGRNYWLLFILPSTDSLRWHLRD